jgi:Uma2 family endonuclease
MATIAPPAPEIDYPEDDGKPLAENTRQFRWIMTIQGGIDSLFAHDPNVFVAGDLLWYPVEGDNTTCTAPDVMVVFDRPRGDRRSYQQWHENGMGPQVVFEILSPGNRGAELMRKYRFYQRFGVEEYYTYDPDNGELSGWLRAAEEFREILPMNGWISPRLGVRFEHVDGELQLYRPDGRRFQTYVELMERTVQACREADEASRRAERLAAQLRALGVNPDEPGAGNR